MSLCLICPPCLAAEPAAQKPGKDTSLYHYYREQLSPYLSSLREKEVQPVKEGDPKGAASAPDSLLSTKSKPDTAAGGGQGGPDQGKKAESSGDRTYLSLFKMDGIGREEINRTLPSMYGKEYIAELALGLRLAPSVDLSFGKAQRFERTENSPWASHNDGWRLRLETNF